MVNLSYYSVVSYNINTGWWNSWFAQQTAWASLQELLWNHYNLSQGPVYIFRKYDGLEIKDYVQATILGQLIYSSLYWKRILASIFSTLCAEITFNAKLHLNEQNHYKTTIH